MIDIIKDIKHDEIDRELNAGNAWLEHLLTGRDTSIAKMAKRPEKKRKTPKVSPKQRRALQ